MAALLGCLAVLIAFGLSTLAIFQRMQPQSENLHVAATHWPEDIPRLLARGDDINQQDADGNTPLHVAIMYWNPESVRLLLDAGADPNVHSSPHADLTPLHRVASEGLAPLTRALLDAGANPNARQKFDETPLHVASTADVARLLIDAGADLEAREHNGNTPLHFAVARRLYDVVEALLAAGASTEAENNHGSKPADSGWGNERMAALFESACASSPTE